VLGRVCVGVGVGCQPGQLVAGSTVRRVCQSSCAAGVPPPSPVSCGCACAAVVIAQGCDALRLPQALLCDGVRAPYTSHRVCQVVAGLLIAAALTAGGSSHGHSRVRVCCRRGVRASLGHCPLPPHPLCAACIAAVCVTSHVHVQGCSVPVPV
jgi:hypothetical protein